jgi:predicted ATPase
MRKYVITGPASCGKTTLIEHLHKKGFPVVFEIAREVLLEGNFHPNVDPFLFQQEIAKRQTIEEEKIQDLDAEIVFLDRGFYDQIAYCYYNGVTELPPEIKLDAQYDGVFVLEALSKFEMDGVRVENTLEEARTTSDMIVREYEKRGISTIHIPAVTVAERIDLVLRKLQTIKTER